MRDRSIVRMTVQEYRKDYAFDELAWIPTNTRSFVCDTIAECWRQFVREYGHDDVTLEWRNNHNSGWRSKNGCQDITITFGNTLF